MPTAVSSSTSAGIHTLSTGTCVRSTAHRPLPANNARKRGVCWSDPHVDPNQLRFRLVSPSFAEPENRRLPACSGSGRNPAKLPFIARGSSGRRFKSCQPDTEFLQVSGRFSFPGSG